MLQVKIVSPEGVLFNGRAASVVCPGESGTFEVLPLHRPLLSRLLKGTVEVDGKQLAITRGIMSVADDLVTVVVEPAQR